MHTGNTLIIIVHVNLSRIYLDLEVLMHTYLIILLSTKSMLLSAENTIFILLHNYSLIMQEIKNLPPSYISHSQWSLVTKMESINIIWTHFCNSVMI